MPENHDTNEHPDRPAHDLSPADANRLWEEYRTGTNPSARDALDRLYRVLRRPLLEFCRTKGCDAELADEIAETAFIRLIVRKPKARRGFLPLLNKTAQNLLYDHRKTAAHSSPLTDDTPRPPAFRALSAGERVVQDETVRAVRECLNTLDPEDRALLLYHHVQGLTQRAACELLSLRAAPSTITARLTRIRDQLARCLEKKKIL